MQMVVFSFIFLFFSEYIELMAKGHLFVHPKRDMATWNNIFLIPKQLHEKFFGIIQALWSQMSVGKGINTNTFSFMCPFPLNVLNTILGISIAISRHVAPFSTSSNLIMKLGTVSSKKLLTI